MERYDLIFSDRIEQSLMGFSFKELIGFIGPKIKKILTVKDFQKVLEKKELSIKFYIDPTAPDIHFGQVVPLLLLDIFIKAGFKIDLVIGDFTAKVGDPTSREVMRRVLTLDDIRLNFETYEYQIGKYINLSSVNVHYNSTWLSDISISDVFSIFQKVNLKRNFQREDFKQRVKKFQGVSLSEICYGVLTGIDSLHLKTNIEIGCVDQLLNFQQCRSVMCGLGINPEVVLMTPALEGIDGGRVKMSSGYGNYISLNSSLEDKFGKIMSIDDSKILMYYCSFALISKEEIGGLKKFITNNPFEAKKQLATFILTLENKDFAKSTLIREWFEEKFSKKSMRLESFKEISVTENLNLFEALLLSNDFVSKSELRRLFDQKAVVYIDGDSRKNANKDDLLKMTKNLIRVGRNKFYKIKLI